MKISLWRIIGLNLFDLYGYGYLRPISALESMASYQYLAMSGRKA